MIKLRTAIPIVALSLSALTLTPSCAKKDLQEAQKTEVLSTQKNKQAVDKFEKSDNNAGEQEKEISPWFLGGVIALAAGMIAYIIHDNKKMKNDPEYARIRLEMNGDHYSEI